MAGVSNQTITMPPAELAVDAGPPCAPRLVLVTVCDQLATVSASHGLGDIDEVRFGRGERGATREVIGGARVLVVRVPDSRMSSDHGRLYRARDGWVLDDPRSKNGAIVDGILTRQAAVGDGSVIELGHTFFRFEALAAYDPRKPTDLRGDELGAPRP